MFLLVGVGGSIRFCAVHGMMLNGLLMTGTIGKPSYTVEPTICGHVIIYVFSPPRGHGIMLWLEKSKFEINHSRLGNKIHNRKNSVTQMCKLESHNARYRVTGCTTVILSTTTSQPSSHHSSWWWDARNWFAKKRCDSVKWSKTLGSLCDVEECGARGSLDKK